MFSGIVWAPGNGPECKSLTDLCHQPPFPGAMPETWITSSDAVSFVASISGLDGTKQAELMAYALTDELPLPPAAAKLIAGHALANLLVFLHRHNINYSAVAVLQDFTCEAMLFWENPRTADTQRLHQMDQMLVGVYGALGEARSAASKNGGITRTMITAGEELALLVEILKSAPGLRNR